MWGGEEEGAKDRDLQRRETEAERDTERKGHGLRDKAPPPATGPEAPTDLQNCGVEGVPCPLPPMPTGWRPRAALCALSWPACPACSFLSASGACTGPPPPPQSAPALAGGSGPQGEGTEVGAEARAGIQAVQSLPNPARSGQGPGLRVSALGCVFALVRGMCASKCVFSCGWACVYLSWGMYLAGLFASRCVCAPRGCGVCVSLGAARGGGGDYMQHVSTTPETCHICLSHPGNPSAEPREHLQMLHGTAVSHRTLEDTLPRELGTCVHTLTEYDFGSTKPKHLLCARPLLGHCFHARGSVSSSVKWA